MMVVKLFVEYQHLSLFGSVTVVFSVMLLVNVYVDAVGVFMLTLGFVASVMLYVNVSVSCAVPSLTVIRME
ncbi:MAG: hypothetical protein B6U72_07090 [Candidatus Altiarchaeales archaeon ex4484_2]|nr:MAG: hypothetical protein B6U72_07090 [Candidatus Altiarchaeales archaeon ex4484_2]